MSKEQSQDAVKRATAVLAEYLSHRETGAEIQWDRLLSEHSDLESELRLLRDNWVRVDALLEALGVGGTLAERIRDRYGSEADPTITLEPESESGPGLTEEVVKRLSGHQGAFGRYRLKGEVARGGQGAILRVWDEDLRRHLAMKVILGKGETRATGATPTVDARALARFLEEAQVTGQLDHPGIVPVHELGLDPEGRVYFTMKLVKGQTLREVLELVAKGEEGWTQTRALGVILKVCEAMAYAHDKKVIHRDLKPGNIMVGRFGEVYVMDWGLAKILGRADEKDIRIREDPGRTTSELRSDRRDKAAEDPESPLYTMDGDVVGTPAYMPPEQARGEIDRVDRRSDVYSVGAMLYHLLAGQTPYVFAGARVSARMILQWVLAGPPKPSRDLNPQVSAELEAICEKAMCRDHQTRYADTQEMAEDLRAYLDGRVVRAYETGAWAEFRKWVQRNRKTASTLAVATIALAAGFIVSTVLYFQAEDARLAESEAKEQALDLAASIDAANRFLDRLLVAIGPGGDGAESLVEAVAEVGVSFSDRPHVCAELQQKAGDAFFALGLVEEAVDEYRRAVETLEAHLGRDSDATQAAIAILGRSLHEAGKYEAARELRQEYLDYCALMRSDPEGKVQVARWDLANTLAALGDFEEARVMEEQVIQVWSGSRLPSDPELFEIRRRHAWTLREIGMLPEALAESLKIRRAFLDEGLVGCREHLHASMDHATVLAELGRHDEALQRLNEASTVCNEASLVKSGDTSFLFLRISLMNSALKKLTLADQESGPRPYPATLHQAAVRQPLDSALPETLAQLRDWHQSRLADASLLLEHGYFERPIALQRSAVDVLSTELPPDNPDLLRARLEFSRALARAGNLRSALVQLGHVCESQARRLPPESELRIGADTELKALKMRIRSLEEVAESIRARLDSPREGDEDRDEATTLRVALARTLMFLGEYEEAESTLRDVTVAVESGLREAARVSDTPTAEAVAEAAGPAISLRFWMASTVFMQPTSSEALETTFELTESARSMRCRVSRASATRVFDRTDSEENLDRGAIQSATSEVARLALLGREREELSRAVQVRDRAERDLRRDRRHSNQSIPESLVVTTEAIEKALDEGEAAVGFWTYDRPIVPSKPEDEPDSTPCLAAFVMVRGEPLRKVELGPVEPILELAWAWRGDTHVRTAAALRGVSRIRKVGAGVDANGMELHHRIVEPIRDLCPDAGRWIVALDGPLHLFPIDALPDGSGLVGDRLRIVVRPALSDLAAKQATLDVSPSLLVLGGVDFGDAPDGHEPPVVSLASGSSRPISQLTGTRTEAEDVAESWKQVFGFRAALWTLDGAEGGKNAVMGALARARFVHIATSFEVSPFVSEETVGEEPSDRSIWGELLRDQCPLTLCTMHLSGANLPIDLNKGSDGIMTAEEVAWLDLSNCELAVLSGCDTSLGVSRRGQGVASFASAFHAAGARTVISSIWKVSDQATIKLMGAFYNNLWNEGMSKAESLWAAKMEIRKRGSRARDWAGWVLSGDPD